MAVRVFHRDTPDRRLPLVASDARLVVWPGVGAWTANMNYVAMRAGEANVPHSHAESEDAIFILEGKGSIDDLTNGTRHEFEANHVVFVPPGVEHRVNADRESPIVSVGGPAPADTALLVRAGLLEEAPR